MRRAAYAAWFLGALMPTVKSVQAGTIPVGVLEMIANPDGRDHAQLRRARDRRGKLFPGAFGLMFDTADDPKHVFNGLAVEAGGGDGNGMYANHDKAKAGFPGAQLLMIDVKDQHIGDAGDFEDGCMAVANAGSWAKHRLDAGVRRPVIYFAVSDWRPIVQSLRGAGVSRNDVRMWTAHYTGRSHLCSSGCGFGVTGTAHATQWASRQARGTLPDEYRGRNMDVSITA